MRGHSLTCSCSECGEALPLFQTRDTSRAAYASVADALPRLEGMVLDYIRAQGRAGATDDQIEVGTGLSHQCASARRNALAAKKLIQILVLADGEPRKRRTRSGRGAWVWVADGATA